MRHFKMQTLLLILVCIVSIVHAQTKILIVGRDHSGQFTTWKSALESVGNVAVTITATTPADLSGYEQVWFADYRNWTSSGGIGGDFQEPSDNAITSILPKYLKAGGKIAFMTDHSSGGSNAASAKVHTQITSFIKSVASNSTNFRIEKDAIWEQTNVDIVIDDRLGVDAKLKAKLQDPTKNYQAEAFTYIVNKYIGSGIGVMKAGKSYSWSPVPSVDAFVGVAFVGTSFTTEYQTGGRVFIFTDIFNSLNETGTGFTKDNTDLLELIASIAGGKDLAETTIDLDTNATSAKIPAGQKIYFNTNQKATITTHAIADISYSVNGSSKGIIGKGVGSFTLDPSFPDSAVVTVTVKGESGTVVVKEQSQSWTFIRKKDATIVLDTVSSLANPIPAGKRVVYNTAAITAFVRGDGDKISYSLNGTVGTPLSGTTGSIQIAATLPDSLKVDVTISGPTVNSKTESWNFIRELPSLKLYLNDLVQANDLGSAESAARTFTTATLPVSIVMKDPSGKSIPLDSKTKIFFTQHNGTPKVDSNEYKDFSIQSSDTIRAIAVVEGYKAPVEGFWVYKQNLPDAQLYLNGQVQANDIASAESEARTFTTATLPVEIVLKNPQGEIIPVDSKTKIFYGQHNQTPKLDSNEFAPFSINASDTIRAIAVVDGYDAPVEGFWVYKQDLPDARLVADTSVALPDSVVFTTPTFRVNLKLLDPKGDQIPFSSKVKIYYATGDTAPKIGSAGTREYDQAQGVVLAKTDTIRAIAVAEGYDAPIPGKWYYVQDLPDAQIVATPSVNVPDSYTFTTSKLFVTLKVIGADGKEIDGSKAAITYALNNGDPRLGKTYRFGDQIEISGNDTLRAAAVLTDFENPRDGIWYYSQKLKSATLKATPGSVISTTPHEYQTASTEVKLETSSGDTVYYAIASRGGKKGVFTDFFVDSGMVTVTGDDTIWAYADGSESNRSDTTWTYFSNLPAATLTADPSAAPIYLFGHTLNITLSSNADTIRYTRDGSIPDNKGTLFVQGKDTIRIAATDPDTVVVRGYAYGDNFKSIMKTWTYVRDTLPMLIATPAGKKFTGKLPVTLAVTGGVKPEWKNPRIYYTLDGTDPDTNDFVYTGSIELDTTVTLKARIFADNRIESPVLVEQYTLVAGASRAWYLDVSGDGAIDGAVIVLTKAVSELPTSLILKSPFDSTETRAVSSKEIAFETTSMLRISLDRPFTFKGSTGFETAIFGAMNGAEYIDAAPVAISDSVAPVLVEAEYSSGKITSLAPAIVRDRDTLEVLFSEPVKIGDLKFPFALRQGGYPYSLKLLNPIGAINSSARFVVDTVIGVQNPVPGDSIHIDVTAAVTAGGVVQNNRDNRWVQMIVNEPPYTLVIQAISPANPDRDTIPAELYPSVYRQETGALVVADFMMQLWSVEKVTAQAIIFDALGNVVAKTGGLNTGTSLVAELIPEPRTRVVFYWDGKNSNGRRVGSGVYIAQIVLTGPDGKMVKEIVPIGIR